MSRLRVAIAGTGYFSQFHYDAWTRLPDTEIVALAGLDQESCEARAKTFGVPAIFSDASEMLDAVKPDIFDLVTPPPTHFSMVKEAAKRGITTICQKPLTPSLKEAEELVAVAEDAGILLAVHENFRFQPWHLHAKAFIEAGRLGDPHSVMFRLRPGDGQGPRAYLDRQPYFQEMERFLIHETGIHFVDTFRCLLGEVEAVTARLRKVNPVIAGEDAGMVIFEFENGTTGLFDGNRLNDHVAENTRLTMGEMFLEGSAGVLRLDGMARLWWKPHGGEEVQETYALPNKGFAGDCVFSLQKHVVEHILHGGPLANSGRDYLTNMRIVDAIYRSNESGRRIAL